MLGPALSERTVPMKLPWSAARLGLVAGLLGGGVGLAVASGVTPAPAPVQLVSAGDDGPTTTSVTVEDDETGASAPTTETRVVDAAGAGTVTVSRDGDSLALVSADPASGWEFDVEQAAGEEIEVEFRNATQRVQVNVELEDGVIQEQVRVRDEAVDTDTRGLDDDDDGQEPADDDDGVDNSGPGSFSSGPSDDDHDDDNSGPGSHDDDDESDDDDNSGPGSHDDDHDSTSGSGSDDSHD